MNKRVRRRRTVVFFMMGLMLAFVFGGGILFLVKSSKPAIADLGYRKYSDWTGNEENRIGKVVDVNDKVLWAVGFAGYDDVYSVIGNPDCPYNKNVVAIRMQDKLFGCDRYNILQGVDSLNQSGRDIKVTLDYDLQNRIVRYMKEYGVKRGSVLVMDASTGAIKACVSLPLPDFSLTPDEMENGALMNRNFATTISGSTLKALVTLLLIERVEGIENEVYYCDGTHELSDGTVVTCITRQGEHNLKSALGVSCNGYYAHMINKYLDADADKVAERLRELGFVVGKFANKEYKPLDESGVLVTKSQINYNGDGGFTSTWSLIGEGEVTVSPIQMAELVAGIVNGGTAAEAYLLELVGNKEDAEYHTAKTRKIMEKESAEKMYDLWKSAYEEFYSDWEYSDHITVAKTGTSEYDGFASSKLLMGYIEEKDEVFFIEVCDYNGGLKPAQIANLIAER